MNSIELIKDMMGDLPFTADIYWLLRQRNRKFYSRFNLDALAERLPELTTQAHAFAARAPRGK